MKRWLRKDRSVRKKLVIWSFQGVQSPSEWRSCRSVSILWITVSFTNNQKGSFFSSSLVPLTLEYVELQLHFTSFHLWKSFLYEMGNIAGGVMVPLPGKCQDIAFGVLTSFGQRALLLSTRASTYSQPCLLFGSWRCQHLSSFFFLFFFFFASRIIHLKRVTICIDSRCYLSLIFLYIYRPGTLH